MKVAQVRGVLAERVLISTPLDPWLDLKGAAGYTSLSPRTLRHYVDLPPDQALPCVRLAGKLLLRRSEIDAWLERFRARGRPSLAKALHELGLTGTANPP